MENLLLEVSSEQEVIESLREKVDYYKHFYDNAPIGFYETTIKDGRFIKANNFFIKSFNFKTIKDLKKYKASDFYKNKDDRIDLVQKVMKTGEVNEFKMESLLVDGETKFFSLSAKLSEDEKTIYGSLLDITETRNMEIKLEEYKTKEISKLHDMDCIIKEKLMQYI